MAAWLYGADASVRFRLRAVLLPLMLVRHPS
jgi:hypothetical protein